MASFRVAATRAARWLGLGSSAGQRLSVVGTLVLAVIAAAAITILSAYVGLFAAIILGAALAGALATPLLKFGWARRDR
jgi:hypothetical protein